MEDSWHKQPQYSWETPLTNPYRENQAQGRWDSPWEDLYGDIPTHSLYENTPTASSMAWENNMGDAPRDVRIYGDSSLNRPYRPSQRSSQRPTSRARGRPYSQRGKSRPDRDSGNHRDSRRVQSAHRRVITSTSHSRARPYSTTHERPGSSSLGLVPPESKSQVEQSSIDPAHNILWSFPRAHQKDGNGIKLQRAQRPSAHTAEGANYLQSSGTVSPGIQSGDISLPSS